MSLKHAEELDASDWVSALNKAFSPGEVTSAFPDRSFTFERLMIRTKDRGLIKLVPNTPQRRFLDLICPRWRSNDYKISGLREMLLKSRQEGFSTLISALLFIDTMQHPQTVTVQISHEEKATERLFGMVRRFYENMPKDLRPAYKYASKTEYYWPEIDCYFYVGTAGSRKFGRGDTINNVHASEVAFWTIDPEEIMDGLMEAVPMTGNIFLETTANGRGNWFHKEWVNASDFKPPKSIFRPRFFPWFEFEDYRITPEQFDKLDLPESLHPDRLELDKEELEVKKLYSLSNEQMAWRKSKTLNEARRKKFDQEYPESPNVAFISSGNVYFNMKRLVTIERQIQTGLFPAIETVEISRHFEALIAALEGLTLWQYPVHGHRYLIAADVSEGLSKNGDHDFSCCDILNAYTNEQVGHFHGGYEPHEFGKILNDLGLWFNFALLAIERNNHGHSVLNTLLNHCGYPRMSSEGVWHGGVYCHEDYDAQTKITSRRPGWPTKPATKIQALSALADAINSRSIGIRNQATVGELMAFRKFPGNKFGAEAGSFDDRVTSLSIGAVLLETEFGTMTMPISGSTDTKAAVTMTPVIGKIGNEQFVPDGLRQLYSIDNRGWQG